MKDYINKKINKMKYEKTVKEGFKLKYIYKGTELTFWEEDAWGRRAREWKVVDIPRYSFEEKPKEEQTNYEQERINKRNILLGGFMQDISKDWYNIRYTWAKRRKWTYNQIIEFNHWLEDTRWPHYF
jgi:hypothetical protein